MSKIKSMIHNKDINMYAISEYRARTIHYEQLTNSLNNYRLKLNINSYLKLIRLHKSFLNAEENLEIMINNLYHAKRTIVSVGDKFYPYGRSSRYITKLQYIESTISDLETRLTNNIALASNVMYDLNHYGMIVYDKVHMDITKLTETNEFGITCVDKLSNVLLTLIECGYLCNTVNNTSSLHSITYLKLIEKLLNKTNEYHHSYYSHIKNIVISKATICGGNLTIGLDEEPDVYIRVLYNYIK